MDANRTAHLSRLLLDRPMLLGLPMVDIQATEDWYGEFDESVHGALSIYRYHCVRPPFRAVILHGAVARRFKAEGTEQINTANASRVFVADVNAAGTQMRVYVFYVGNRATWDLGYVSIGMGPQGEPLPTAHDGLLEVHLTDGAQELFERGGLARDMFGSELANQTHPALFAFALLHAKNVRLSEGDTLPRSVRRAKHAPEVAQVQRYTLHVEGFKRQAQADTRSGDSSYLTALHLCRGSFATYGEENKLFGRHTGTFWRPAHLKGKQEAGVIVKDYAIKGVQ